MIAQLLPHGAIARGTIRTTFVLGLRLAVQAGTLLLVARMLGPDQFGAFAGVAALAVMLGTLSTFGTHLVLLGEVSKEPARRTQVLSYAVPTTLMCGGVLLVLYLALCLTLLSHAHVALPALVAIGIAEMWLQPLFALPTTEHLALDRTARSQLLATLPLALRLTAITCVLLLHPTSPLAAYAYGYFASSLAALAIATTTMPEPWPAIRDWRLPARSELRVAIGYAALAVTASGPVELDKTLATRLLSPAASGAYAVGSRVIGATTLPVTALLLSALPRLFRTAQRNSNNDTYLVSHILLSTVIYGLILSLSLWHVASAIVWLFGVKYRDVQSVIHWLCLVPPGMASRLAIGNILMASGKPWMRVIFELTGLIVLFVASIVIAPHYGLAGMSISVASSEYSMAIMGVALYRHHLGQARDRLSTTR